MKNNEVMRSHRDFIIDRFVLSDDGCIIMISNNDIVTPLSNKEVVELLNDMINKGDD